MRKITMLSAAVLLSSAGMASANTCEAGKLMCATQMPVGGYCECTKHGDTEGGTVVSHASGKHATNATAGGCGVHPDAPGCR